MVRMVNNLTEMVMNLLQKLLAGWSKSTGATGHGILQLRKLGNLGSSLDFVTYDM